MLKESGIFFAVCVINGYTDKWFDLCSLLQLLSVLAIGFAQGLYALDAADGSTDPPSSVNKQLYILDSCLF
jgi:hypothetical protein